jgi:hypothetical protein
MQSSSNAATPVVPESMTISEATLALMSIDSEASSSYNWHGKGGSFERAIGPGLWHEPGLKALRH